MFDWIGDLFSRLWKAFKRILPYILIACAIWLSFGLAIPLFAGLVIEGTVMNALLFLGASFLFVPDETVMALQPAIEAIGDIAQSAATEAGEVAGSLVDSLSNALGLPSIALIVGAGVLIYFLMKTRSNTPDPDGIEERETEAIRGDADVVVASSVDLGLLEGGA